MRILLLLLLFISYLFSCSGDCLSCHPKLAKNILMDERHKPMLTCIACHKNEESGISECGKDCFACHDVKKIDNSVEEHQVIEGCRNCHMNLPDTLDSAPESSTDTTVQEMLFQGMKF